MSNKNDQTASFVMRFTQKLFKNEAGKDDLQWRGKITHVQGDEHKYFNDMQDAMNFMQNKLSQLTLKAVDDKSAEDQRGLLQKSLGIWKSISKNYPKKIIEVIKDPKAQVNQLQDQISHVGEELSSKIELDAWMPSSKTDLQTIGDQLNELKKSIEKLNKKMSSVEKKLK